MTDLENRLRSTDFSRYTDLKERLADKLFGEGVNRDLGCCPLTDDDLNLVHAARGLDFQNTETKPHG